MPRRLFTLARATELVPRLTLLLERLQRGALELDEAAAALDGPPEARTLERLLEARPQLRRVVEELDAAVEEIHALGAELKDVRLGLVDFPARLGGEDVHLCWQFGEDAIGYWHRQGEGFAGRRRLPGAPVRQLQ